MDVNSIITNTKDILKTPPIKSAKVPRVLVAKARERTGLSAIEMKAEIYSKLADAGIPIGTFIDGTPDLMGVMIGTIIDVIVDHLQTKAKITIGIDPGIQVTSQGGNAGGPVTSQGQTITYGIGGGIIQ